MLPPGHWITAVGLLIDAGAFGILRGSFGAAHMNTLKMVCGISKIRSQRVSDQGGITFETTVYLAEFIINAM